MHDFAEGRVGSNAGVVPILPSMGPIAVQDVANLVASASDNLGVGGLLEGSQSVMQAVARSSGAGGPATEDHRLMSNTDDDFSAGSGASTPRKAAAAQSRLGLGQQYSSGDSSGMQRESRESRGSESFNGRSQSDSLTPERAASDSASEDGDEQHERFVSWLSSHELFASLDEDLSDFYPEQLPDEDFDNTPGAAAGTPADLGPTAAATEAAAVPAARGDSNRLTASSSSSMPPAPSTPEPSAARLPPVYPHPAAVGTAAGADKAGPQVLLDDANLLNTAAGEAPALSLLRRSSLGALNAPVADMCEGRSQHRRTGSEPQGNQLLLRPTTSAVIRSFDDGWQEGLVGERAGSGPASEHGDGDADQGEAGYEAVATNEPSPLSRPANLPRIKTATTPLTSAAVPVPAATAPKKRADGASTAGAAGSSAATGGAGAGSNPVQFCRVSLPGRALLPAGISDTVVPIFDNEPTSIVAYFLSTRSYQQQLNASIKGIFQEERKDRADRQSQHSDKKDRQPPQNERRGDASSSGHQQTGNSRQQQGHIVSQQSSNQPQPQAGGSHARGRSMDAAAAVAAASVAAVAAGVVIAANGSSTPEKCGDHLNEGDWLSLLLSPEACHVKHTFEDDSPGTPWLRARFAVTAYFAPQFAELRRRCITGGEGAFITSLCRCRKWASRGGKSNAYFAKTKDDRFIVKSLSKPEKASFLEFAPAYFEHLARAMQSGRTTCLAKVAGVFSIAMKGGGGGAGTGSNSGPPAPFKDGVIDVVVMENIFYDRQISRIYDLKGSERSRFNESAAANPQDAGEVHLDDNLRRSNLQVSG